MTTVTDPPDDWTTSADEMRVDFHWGAKGGGTSAAAAAGLPASVTPLMIKGSDSGSDGYVFAADGKFYLWNMVTGSVYEYTKPADLDGILAEMRKPGGKVETKVLLVGAD